MDAAQLLSHFEYGWKDVLPAMLDADPMKRPVDLRGLAERLTCVRVVAEKSPRRWLKWVMAGVTLAALAAGVAYWLVPRSERSAGQDEDMILNDAFEVPESVK